MNPNHDEKGLFKSGVGPEGIEHELTGKVQDGRRGKLLQVRYKLADQVLPDARYHTWVPQEYFQPEKIAHLVQNQTEFVEAEENESLARRNAVSQYYLEHGQAAIIDYICPELNPDGSLKEVSDGHG